MAISELKKKIVIDNYFKSECDVNTSIKQAFTKGFELGLKKAPIPQPKTGWIPVSERLPEDFQRVLVTIVNYNGDKVVRVAEYYNYNNNRKGIFQIKENHEQWEVGEKGLLAWMPLPEPYKEVSE